MGQVKGLFIIPWVKMIRADKQRDYNRWLDDEDREMLSQRIFASTWYPFSVYQHLFDAVVAELASNDEKTIYQWGCDYAQELLKSTYRTIIVPNDPLESMKKNMYFNGLFYDFGNFSVKVTGEKSFEVHIDEFPREFKNLYLLLRGWYTKLIEMAGAKNVESNFIGKSWDGAPSTIIEYHFS